LIKNIIIISHAQASLALEASASMAGSRHPWFFDLVDA